MGNNIIQVNNLIKSFGLKVVLKDLNFSVERGEFVTLLGPNGAGKTTLLRILSSISRPSNGDIRIAGYHLPQQAPNVRKILGFVSHQPLLYGDLTADENLRFYGRMYGVLDLQHRIDEVMEMLGLELRRLDLVRTYSRGMQQRLAIGRAVLHNPEVILFDEPHTGLDQDSCIMLDNVLREVAGRGHTVVMTSHDLERAASLASRFDIISRGKIAASGRSSVLPASLRLLEFYRQAIQDKS